jgi:hypothetical protein
VPNTNGFYVMASNPRGLPEFVMPVELPDSYEQKARKLKSHNMSKRLNLAIHVAGNRFDIR